MKQVYKGFLFLTISFAFFGQTNPKVSSPNVDIHIMPLALAHPDPSLRIGSEYMTAGRWSYGRSLGVGFAQSRINLPGSTKVKSRDNYRMFEVRLEVKYYWLRREYMGGYAAAEGVVMSRNNRFFDHAHYLDNRNEI